MKKLVVLSCLFLSLTSVTSQTFSTEKKKDPQGYVYETVKNDKTGVRVYTLKNGLKVYLAQNTDEPRFQEEQVPTMTRRTIPVWRIIWSIWFSKEPAK